MQIFSFYGQRDAKSEAILDSNRFGVREQISSKLKGGWVLAGTSIRKWSGLLRWKLDELRKIIVA